MTSGPEPTDRWSQLSSLLDALLDTPPERRAEVITQLSSGDPARRAELERLVAELGREAPLIDAPVVERFGALLEDPAAGFPEVLADRYRLTREIGRGGMATVYLARDLRHSRDVAVKVVSPMLASALGGDRFLREIEIVANLRHPHIVPLFDSGNAGGAPYYVMPFETGLSLRQRLARAGPLPIADAVTILRDVSDALAHAHEHGIVHRDIKPDNVMLSGRHAMVTDFGVAKAIVASSAEERFAHTDPNVSVEAKAEADTAPTTTQGVAFGTPAYMAPEQIVGDPRIDHRADIYAVGALAYELLAGRPPFVGTSRDEVLAGHLSRAPSPVTTHRADAPAPLAELVMACLAKDPSDRPQTANELVERLERIAGRGRTATAPRTRRSRWLTATAVLTLAAAAAFLIERQRAAGHNASWSARWALARVERLTDFPGTEVDASISADGQRVAFLADRDSVFDAFVTRVGSEQFVNLTSGKFPQLLNEDVRNVGFSGDGASAWIRVADITAPASVWLAPTDGGPFRPFLGTAVMAAWSPDGSRLAYHETTPGDPIYVGDRNGANSRRIHVAESGIHSHHLSWSSNGQYLFFTHGVPPNDMDIWRIPAAGGQAERVTHHNSRVGYPVSLDDRTLLYTATASDGTGPWLYSMDLGTGASQRVITGVEHYISIAASAEVAGQPRRLVATVSNPTVGLWSAPIVTGVAGEDSAQRLALPTARSAAPRFARDGTLYYLAARGGADAVWRLAGDRATELWKAPDGAIDGAVAVSPDGSQLCASVRQPERSTLYCFSATGAGGRSVAESLDVRGAPSWSPDGEWIAVAARDGPAVHVFKVPAGGGEPVRLVDSVSANPVWSPNGKLIIYSGASRARIVPLKAVTPDGHPYPIPEISVDRVGDSYRFLPGGDELVVKLGGFRRQDFWSVDLASGRRRRLTTLKPGESLQRFDVSPDGKRILFERVRENSDIALIVLPPG
ncbi:MAG TPA: protein kinase [Gemmatimonadaceae bacterium]|nr:protein kinase [Gemmatimonadaceae bacterium]